MSCLMQPGLDLDIWDVGLPALSLDIWSEAVRSVPSVEMCSLSLEVSLVWGCTGMPGLSLHVLSDAVWGMSGLRLFSPSSDD